jgi:hypothetical protein
MALAHGADERDAKNHHRTGEDGHSSRSEITAHIAAPHCRPW